MRIVFRINAKQDGKWKPLGTFREEDAPTAHAAARRVVGPEVELQTGGCSVNPKSEQWKK